MFCRTDPLKLLLNQLPQILWHIEVEVFHPLWQRPLTFPLRYYGPRDFDRALGPGFRRVETRSLGLCLPPLSFGPQMARMPRLLDALAAVEDRLAGLPGLCHLGDHVIVVYERT